MHVCKSSKIDNATASNNLGAKVRRKTEILPISSKKYFTAIQHENLAFTCLPDFITVQKLKLTSALVVIILDADASFPFLDFARFCP